MVIMRSASSLPLLRRLRSHRAALDVTDAAPVVAEPTFVCSVCHREMSIAERSRVAPGRCRACV
jgi:hypothetical protein